MRFPRKNFVFARGIPQNLVEALRFQEGFRTPCLIPIGVPRSSPGLSKGSRDGRDGCVCAIFPTRANCTTTSAFACYASLPRSSPCVRRVATQPRARTAARSRGWCGPAPTGFLRSLSSRASTARRPRTPLRHRCAMVRRLRREVSLGSEISVTDAEAVGSAPPWGFADSLPARPALEIRKSQRGLPGFLRARDPCQCAGGCLALRAGGGAPG